MRLHNKQIPEQLILCVKQKNEDHKYQPQIFLEECQSEEKKPEKNKRHIKEKRLIPDSNEHDESNDESIK